MMKPFGRALLWAALVALTSDLAHAQIYVENDFSSYVSEYSLTGQTIANPLIRNVAAVDSMAISGGDLFVASTSTGSVGEYTLNGTAINSSLVSLTNGSAYGIAVSGNDLYVGTYSGVDLYNLSTNLLTSSFITGLASTADMAVYNGNLFVVNNAGFTDSTIEEFNASTGALENSSFIANLPDTFAMVIGAGYIYTGSYAGGTVSQYTLSGQLVNANFISGLTDAGVNGLALAAGVLYVTDDATNAVRSYNATTGALLNSDLISVSSDPEGIIVVPEPGSVALATLGALALAGIALRRRARA